MSDKSVSKNIDKAAKARKLEKQEKGNNVVFRENTKV